MKKILLLSVLTMGALASFSQEKATLTKEETINNLNKKIKEIDGHYRTDSKALYYYSQSVSKSSEQIIVTSSYRNYADNPRVNDYYKGNVYPCDYFENSFSHTFNPGHIKSISLKSNPNDPVAIIVITLIGKTASERFVNAGTTTNINGGNYGGKCNGWATPEKSSSTSEIWFPFLQSDPTNFNKIKKALEYLRDLYKAEDDPFGN